jgi:methionine aminopeptidase
MRNTLTLCKAGANISELCVTSDAFVKKCLMNIYTKKKYIKGLAFPTSVSVNEVCGNFAPVKYDANSRVEDHEYRVLSVGDVVKVDLGVQIQGFASVLSHTLVVTEKPEDVVTGKHSK